MAAHDAAMKETNVFSENTGIALAAIVLTLGGGDSRPGGSCRRRRYDHSACFGRDEDSGLISAPTEFRATIVEGKMRRWQDKNPIKKRRG